MHRAMIAAVVNRMMRRQLKALSSRSRITRLGGRLRVVPLIGKTPAWVSRGGAARTARRRRAEGAFQGCSCRDPASTHQVVEQGVVARSGPRGREGLRPLAEQAGRA